MPISILAQDGSLDTTFGSGGIVITTVGIGDGTGDFAESVVIQNDGKILVSGNSKFINDNKGNTTIIVRYNSNGSLENSFVSRGIVITSVGNDDDSATCLALQTDGKILAAGQASFISNIQYTFSLVRYNSMVV